MMASLSSKRSPSASSSTPVRHDVTDEGAAYLLAEDQYPGKFGVFFEEDRPSKNTLEQKWIDSSRERVGEATPADLLRQRFAIMK